MLHIRLFLLSVLLVNLAQTSDIVNPIDSTYLLGLFTSRMQNGKSFKLLDPQLNDWTSEIERSFVVFLEEQCIFKCFQYTQCVRYLHEPLSNQCFIYLRPNYKRRIESSDAEKLKAYIGCDLRLCTDSIYCLPFTEPNGKCLCDPSTANGDDCSFKTTYELSAWSEWSECSEKCGGGISERSRKCFQKYYDAKLRVNVSEEMVGKSWLCQEQDNYQVKECNTDECRVYGAWSTWSTCSKLCGGYRTRSRECVSNNGNPCNPNFLQETEPCSFVDDCANTILVFESNRIGDAVINYGTLKLLNTKENIQMRLLTNDNSTESVKRLSRTACVEFGYIRSIYEKLTPIVDVSNQLNYYEQQIYMDENHFKGISCNASVETFKECQLVEKIKESSALYEIEIECLYNGYWSPWLPWSACSVTCGAGARTRQRTCTDPKPSSPVNVPVSEDNQGESCGPDATDFTNCVMPRCRN